MILVSFDRSDELTGLLPVELRALSHAALSASRGACVSDTSSGSQVDGAHADPGTTSDQLAFHLQDLPSSSTDLGWPGLTRGAP